MLEKWLQVRSGAQLIPDILTIFNLAETAEPGPRPIAIALDTVSSTLIRTHVR